MRLLSGQQFAVPCEPGATVADVKQSLAALEGGPKRCRLTLRVSWLLSPPCRQCFRLQAQLIPPGPTIYRALSWVMVYNWKAWGCAKGSSW